MAPEKISISCQHIQIEKVHIEVQVFTLSWKGMSGHIGHSVPQGYKQLQRNCASSLRTEPEWSRLLHSPPLLVVLAQPSLCIYVTCLTPASNWEGLSAGCIVSDYSLFAEWVLGI